MCYCNNSHALVTIRYNEKNLVFWHILDIQFIK